MVSPPLQMGEPPSSEAQRVPCPGRTPSLLSQRGWENDWNGTRQECLKLPLFLLEVQQFNHKRFTDYCLQLLLGRGFADLLIPPQLEISPFYICLTAFFFFFIFSGFFLIDVNVLLIGPLCSVIYCYLFLCYCLLFCFLMELFQLDLDVMDSVLLLVPNHTSSVFCNASSTLHCC